MSMVDREPWRRKAACIGADTNLWFPDEGQQVQSRAAKRYCVEECPVLLQCQEWALAQGPTLYGIFGGLSKEDRAKLRRKAS